MPQKVMALMVVLSRRENANNVAYPMPNEQIEIGSGFSGLGYIQDTATQSSPPRQIRLQSIISHLSFCTLHIYQIGIFEIGEFPSGQKRLHLLLPILEDHAVLANAVNKAHIDDVAAMSGIKAG